MNKRKPLTRWTWVREQFPDELLSKRLPEMPAQLVPIIEEIWAEDVVGK